MNYLPLCYREDLSATLMREAMDGMEATQREPHLSEFELGLSEDRQIRVCVNCGTEIDENGRCGYEGDD